MVASIVTRRASAAFAFSIIAALVAIAFPASAALAQRSGEEALPVLTAPVNDLAGVIDPDSARELDRLSRALQAATGDAIVVVTIPSAAAYGDIRAYANELFQNHGRGIGEQGKDNGLLIVVAVQDRRTWTEVGYGLEGIITDGFAGETSRQLMTPAFRQGQYGAGLLAAVRRFAGRIAGARGVRIENLPVPASEPRTGREPDHGWLAFIIFAVFVLLILSSARGSQRRRRRVFWGGGPWSGWSGGGFGGGGFGGGGFGGGGFGGFGGGGSGGGGGGSSW